MREPTDDGGTGDTQVDEAVRTLDTLDGLPVQEHAAVFERVHQVLQDRLTGEPDDVDLDDADGLAGPAGGAPPGHVQRDEWGAGDAGPGDDEG